MIRERAFPVEPWCIRETRLDLDVLAQSESVFALSNGHVGLRGNLDEGEPHGLPGTYLNSFYELRPLPYAEAGYGFPESGQTIVNVTNGKLIRLLVDDEPLDVRYGELLDHERHARPARRHAAPAAALALPGRPGGPGPHHPARLLHPAFGRRDPLRGGGGRRTPSASPSSPSWWPTRRCRAQSRDPRVAAVLESPAAGRGAADSRRAAAC